MKINIEEYRGAHTAVPELAKIQFFIVMAVMVVAVLFVSSF